MKRVTRLPQWPPRLPGLAGWLRWYVLARLLLALVTVGVLTTLVYYHFDSLQIGQRAPRDIQAPANTTWEDVTETRRRQDEAASQIQTIYQFDPLAKRLADADLTRACGLLRAPQLTDADRAVLDQMKIPDSLVEETRSWDARTWTSVQRTAGELLAEVMSTRIEQGNTEQQAQQQINVLAQARVTDAQRSRAVATLVRAVLRPTWLKDEIRTEDRRQEARRQVKPAIRNLRLHDIIVHKGEIISAEMMAQLQDKQLLAAPPLSRLMPAAALMLFAVMLLGVYLRAYCRPIFTNDRKLLLLASLIIASLWVYMTLGREQSSLVALTAIPAGNMAVAGLLGVPVALVTTMLTSVTAGLTADNQFAIALLTLGSSLVGIMAVSAIWPASRAIPGVLSLVLVNLGLLIVVEGIKPGGGFDSVWQDLGAIALCAGAGGVGATFVAVGAIYILARPFGITTHYRLMELTNPNEALLRRMMIEAPGSYHSSVMVANLAEAAADAIGINALLTRVGALYHDIGKLKRPAFFVENQAPLGLENVHQRLSAKLSYLILISHVRDGIELARKHALPEEVTGIIREHHGTTLAAYFYHRALNESARGHVSEHDFRYAGPKPTTREAAVVMLADSVQAAVKAIKEPTPGRIESMVHEIINNRLEDGQLEDCDITLRNLRMVGEVFVRILSGLYSYSRLEYPDIKGGGTRLRAHLHSATTSVADEKATAAPSH